MRKVLAALVLAGLLLVACSSAPSYTVQDAIKTLNASPIKANRDPPFNACFAKYLFRYVSPAEAKVIVTEAHASQTKSQNVVWTGAELYCLRHVAFK
jgi:hypothetical protein